MIKVVGQTLGEYGEQLVAEIEKKIAEEVGKLRAEVNLKRASDDGNVVVLPNPLREWSGQALAAAKAGLKPRIPRKQSTSSLVHRVNNSHSLYAHSGHAT